MAFSGDTDDLATLSRLDEQVLVYQLHRRYDADKIYVRLLSLIFSDFTFSIALSLIPISADLHRRHSGRCQPFPPTGNLYSKGQFTCLFSRIASHQDRMVSLNFRQFQALYRNRTKHDAAPHIFATADAAYHNLMDSKKDQCCVVRYCFFFLWGGFPFLSLIRLSHCLSVERVVPARQSRQNSSSNKLWNFAKLDRVQHH